MDWTSFEYEEKTYDLSHLNTFEMCCVQAAKGGKPERHYHFKVTFSVHCFTRGQKHDEAVEPELLYRDSRETRIFDFRRYALSKRLPDIVKELGQTRKCFHTGKGNYFTVDVQNQDGSVEEYDVYFKVSRSGKGKLSLFVQSAYIRDQNHKGNRPKKKPISFMVIAYNTQLGKSIKAPK